MGLILLSRMKDIKKFYTLAKTLMPPIVKFYPSNLLRVNNMTLGTIFTTLGV